MKGTSINYSIVTQQNQGQGVARNTGVENANGDWVLFLDSDDVLHSAALESYAKAIEEHPDVEFLFSKFQNVTEENLFMEVALKNKVTTISREKLLKGFLTRKLTILVPGSVYKMSLLKDKHIWHTAIRWSEDQHFMWRVLDGVKGGVFVESCLYNYLHRSAGGSIMNATPLETMLVAYAEFCTLEQNLRDNTVKNFLVSRWVLGCLNVLAHRKDKQGWVTFFDRTNGFKHLKILRTFPDWKVRVLTCLGQINKGWMYTVMRIL